MSPRVFSLSSLLGNSMHRKSKSIPPPLPVPSPEGIPTGSSQALQARNGHPHARAPSVGQPPLLDVTHETPPELQPVFSYLTSHSKKLYAEGYFLKLSDLNPDGKPHADRQWQECFAQLVGTVLSLWDAAALDAMGDEGDVVPTYLNLADSSIKMIETLPTKATGSPTLRNVLSISTAGKNRYLFHFNSHHSLVQWTAGIRLSLFEFTTLQEAYTGALIAGKGKLINGIANIMERTRFKYEDWARVRFAAGEPWRKYWAVITPPDEKAYTKRKKEIKKGKSPREPLKLGNLKFYLTKKTKNVEPIATVTDAFSSLAVYPLSEALIEYSTLVKLEGKIARDAEGPKEGFVFVMPAMHPSVSGFEMMIRWLFPTFDAFHLYGRPGPLAADVMDVRSLMFAMPREAKYGYLEVSDVARLITDSNGSIKSEAEWRQKLKELTLTKMQSDHQGVRSSFHPVTSPVPFGENRSSVCSTPIIPYPGHYVPPSPSSLVPFGQHKRSISEAQGQLAYPDHGTTLTGYTRYDTALPSGSTPQLPANGQPSVAGDESDDESDNLFESMPPRPGAQRQQTELPVDVPFTPAMAHTPSSKPSHPLPPTPAFQPRMSIATLDALVQAAGANARSEADRSTPSPYVTQQPYQQHPWQGTEDEDVLDPISNSSSRARNDSMASSSQTAHSEGLPTNDHRGFAPPPRQLPQIPHPLPATESQTAAHRSFSDRVELEAPSGYIDYSFADTATHSLTQHPEGAALDDGSPNLTEQPPNAYTMFPQIGQAQQAQFPSPEIHEPHGQSLEVDSSLMTSKIPPTQNQSPQPSPIKTDLPPRIILPYQESANDTPQSTDSMASLANHILTAEALNRISQNLNPLSVAPDDEDTLDRKEAAKLMRKLNESESEYEDDEIDEYATDSEPEVIITPRKVVPRAGVMKTVGQTKAADIVIGESRYRAGTGASQEQEVSSEIPKVDFGRTLNHGRSLSTGTALNVLSTPRASSRGSVLLHAEGIMSVDQVNTSEYARSSYQQSPPNGPKGTDGKRREYTKQQMVPDSVRANDGDRPVPRERNMAWQPGLVQTTGYSKAPGRSETPDRFVAEQAEVANQQSQARNRVAHVRRLSGNLLRSPTPTGASRPISTDQMPQPSSRVASGAYLPHGLISAPDLSSHLSAREQEYVARATGTTLLQMEGGKVRKQPPHQAGLLGALEAREKEKKDMRESWNSSQIVSNNITIQQALAQRQRHVRTASSGNRGFGPSDPLGRAMGQQAVPEYTMQSQLYQQSGQQQGYGNQGSYTHYHGSGGR